MCNAGGLPIAIHLSASLALFQRIWVVAMDSETEPGETDIKFLNKRHLMLSNMQRRLIDLDKRLGKRFDIPSTDEIPQPLHPISSAIYWPQYDAVYVPTDPPQNRCGS